MVRCALVTLGLGLILALGRVPTAGTRAAAPATASPVAARGDVASLVAIGGGHRVWLECRGEGSPTVILIAGTGNDADTWNAAGLAPGAPSLAVLPGVAAFTRVCAYDRPGTLLDAEHLGRSDPAPMPQTAATMVAD